MSLLDVKRLSLLLGRSIALDASAGSSWECSPSCGSASILSLFERLSGPGVCWVVISLAGDSCSPTPGPRTLNVSVDGSLWGPCTSSFGVEEWRPRESTSISVDGRRCARTLSSIRYHEGRSTCCPLSWPFESYQIVYSTKVITWLEVQAFPSPYCPTAAYYERRNESIFVKKWFTHTYFF